MDARFEETVEYRAVDDSGPNPEPSAAEPPSTLGTTPRHPRPDLIAGEGPDLGSETRSLLRRRLRAASGFLAMTALAFYVRNLLLGLESFGLLHPTVLAFQFGVAAALTPRRDWKLRELRLLELAVFGVTLAFLLVRQYRIEVIRIASNDPAQLLASIKDGIFSVFAVIMVYGMLIPNTWRRAAAVVLPMAVSPVVVPMMLARLHPEFIVHASRIAGIELLTTNALILVTGAALAIFGSYIINALRVEAFEARQLGQYHLRDKLGAGGMGEVYLAEHMLLKRPCALKIIRPERAGDIQALARFEREVRTTARLSHPNTVEIYDYGRTDDGTFFYVMEYLRGLSLAELVERYGPLPPGRVIHLLRQACGALGEAHAAGLVHRDVKPANLFACRRGGLHDVVKVLDFGLVRSHDDPESAHDAQVSGSPLYMSPEQADPRRKPDVRSDIYALGGVGFFLLTGQPPFAGSTMAQVLAAHASRPVEPPSGHNPGVPPDLDAVILRCLAKDPADRYPTAEALDAALADCDHAAAWDARVAALWWSEAEQAPDPTPAPQAAHA